MRRVVVVLSVFGLLAAVLALSGSFRPPVDAQDRTEERLSDLETRVAELETVVASGSGGTSSGSAGTTRTLVGTLRLIAGGSDSLPQLAHDGDGCRSYQRGYTDDFGAIEEGTQVAIKDQTGVVIAISEITESEATVSREYEDGTYWGECSLTFTAGGVPEVAFYQIEIGPRVMPLVSYEDLDEKGWTVVFVTSN